MNTPEIQYIPLGEVLSWKRNPKTHNIPAIIESMERFGFMQPLIRDDATSRLVAGHGRLEALTQMLGKDKPAPKNILVVKGVWHVPVITGISFLSEAEAESYLLADNRLVELGGWDNAMLVSLLQINASLAGTGYTEAELDEKIMQLKQGTKEGITPKETLDRYENGDTKQIVLYFMLEEYHLVMQRLADYQIKNKLQDNRAVLLHLLEQYK